MSEILPSSQLLELVGPDAVAFAHAQFSSNVRALANGYWQWSAWLSPQGRVRGLFHLLRDNDEHLRLLIRGGDACELAEALRRFVLRAKVEMRRVEGVKLRGSFDTATVSESIDSSDDAFKLGYASGTTLLAMPGENARWLIVDENADKSEMPADAVNRWRLADIHAGLPSLAPALQDRLLPSWLGLNRLGAISVDKGCYPGQEIVSRMHFKGGNTRSLYLVELASGPIPAAGCVVRVQSERNAPAGQIVDAAVASGRRIEALASLQDACNEEKLLLDSAEPTRITVKHRFS